MEEAKQKYFKEESAKQDSRQQLPVDDSQENKGDNINPPARDGHNGGGRKSREEQITKVNKMR